jgi:type VI secretion system secreted protein VgrG
MASPNTQDRRIGELKTPLGDNTLVLTGFQATEGVSELFECRIEALCSKDEILDFTEAIGKHCSVSINCIGGGKRWFDGILAESQCTGIGNGGLNYSLVLRPWLWVISHRKDSWIFHDKTAPQIIEEVLDDHGGLAVRQAILKKTYPKLEYCVQYRESDMAFVCRLMEQHGISYHFRHSEGKHEMIMGDDSSAWKKIERGARPYYPVEGQHARKEEHFFDWIPERRFTTGKVTLKDYYFETPGNKLEVQKTGDAGFEHGKLEGYDSPGLYTKESEGEFYAQARIDMERAADERFLATGDCASCYPGSLVSVEKHPYGDMNKEYVALRCTHSLSREDYRSGGSSETTETYRGSYEFIRSNRSYAPPLVTEKPFVQGPQTAVVVGDGEIHCDKYGRIRVRFHWDRASDQSMWCRLSQVWAGSGWGGMFIPRKGMEVICDFLEGDPDRPIIIGCVYNADNMPPYPLAGQKNIAGIKSNSTEGGGGYNEFIFDDTVGKELIRTHAQYDMESTILHDERRTIMNDRSTAITNNESLLVLMDRATTVGRNRTELIIGNEVMTVGKKRTTKVGDNDTLTVGKNLLIKAGNSITLKVGGSSIKITKTKILIKSQLVEIKASMAFKSTAGLISKHIAKGFMTIKGALVKINS